MLGNYTKGALHFKDKGEFGVYIGDAMLMFQLFKLEEGLVGLVSEYWNRYLLHNEPPIGVVSGPANALPREWRRAWRACYAADQRLMNIYEPALARFNDACAPAQNGERVNKTIACLKYALKLDGVIESDRVADQTPSLSEEDRNRFAAAYDQIKRDLEQNTDEIWRTRTES